MTARQFKLAFAGAMLVCTAFFAWRREPETAIAFALLGAILL